VLTFEDCLALCGLTAEEIVAIAEHEHIPELAAAEMGNYLCRSPSGELRIKHMIIDDIEAARAAGKLDRAAALRLVLRHFVECHPGGDERRRARRSV
jgi:hypothetical protein